MNEDLLIMQVVNNTERIGDLENHMSTIDDKLDVIIEGQDEMLGLLKRGEQERASMLHALYRHETDIERLKSFHQ